jgi:hypothetical protein
MQLLVQDASELFMAITLVIGAVILANYTRKRIADLSPEERSTAGLPLYLSSVGIFVLAIASFYNFMIDLNAAALAVNATYYAFTLFAATFFAIAALLILEYKKAIIIPLVMLIGGLTFTYAVAFMSLPVSMGMVTGPISLVLNLVPIGLFLYLARKTSRITAIALGFLLITYLLQPIATIATDPSLIAAILGIRLLGPAMVILAFLKPELGISVELFGYTISVNIVAFWFSYALAYGAASLDVFIGIAMIAIVSLLGFTIGTYTLSRYRASRNTATALIGAYFFTAGISHIIISLAAIGVLVGATNEYMIAILGVIGMMFFNLSAFIALDWKRTSLLPVLLIVPVLVYMFISFPTPLALVYAYSDVFGTTNIIQILVPVGLYGMLWRKMKQAEAPGRNRPLFLAIGLVLLIIGGVVATIVTGNVQEIVSVPSASILVVAFLIFLVGITGYADKWLGTAKQEA